MAPIVFSVSEWEAQVHYHDNALSVVRPLSLTFHIFDFSETTERNSTKLVMKHNLNVLYQVFVFGTIGKLRWPQRPMVGRDIFDFSSETAEQNSMKPDRKQDFYVVYQVCAFRADRKKTKWPPWSLIGWDILDFSSETAERNSNNLDSKQDLNVLYQVCVFRADRKNNGRPGLWLAETFFTTHLKRLNRIQRRLTGSKISTATTNFVFFGPIGKKMMAAPASGWLRHFRLFWHRWTEFRETWQEARPQRPLPSLCFLGRSEKANWPPWPLIG